jgi:hypothetical protein
VLLCQAKVEIGDTGGDVIADGAHTVDAVNAAFRGFVGVPVLELRSGYSVDVCFTANRDDDVDFSNERRSMSLGVSAVMSTPTSSSDCTESALRDRRLR